MKDKYDIYRPQFINNDVYRTSKSYYEAPDVRLSPMMTVGSLADNAREETPAKLQASSAVFGSNFKPNHEVTKRPSPDSAVLVNKKQRRAFTIGLTAAASTLASIWASIANARKSIHWLPKKYQLDRGLRNDFSGKAFKGAKIAAPVIALGLGVLVAMQSNNLPTETIDGGNSQQVARKTKAMPVQSVATSSTVSAGSAQASNSAVTQSVNGNTTWSVASTSTPTTSDSMQGGSIADTPVSTTTPTNPSTGETTQPTDPTTGTGDGGDTGSTPTDPADPTPTLPLPGVDLNLGDTPILSTGDGTISIL